MAQSREASREVVQTVEAASATMALVPIAMFFVVLAGRAGLRALRSRRVRADRRRAVVETPTRRSVSP